MFFVVCLRDNMRDGGGGGGGKERESLTKFACGGQRVRGRAQSRAQGMGIE